MNKISHDEYAAALDLLIDLAMTDCGGGQAAADFLIAWRRHEGWVPTQMWRLSGAYRAALIIVLTQMATHHDVVYPPREPLIEIIKRHRGAA